MLILGLNAYHPDAAVALVRDGRLVWAAEEERYNRVKHAAGFPHLALRQCLLENELRLQDLSAVALGKNPRANLRRKLAWIARTPPTRALLANSYRAWRKGASLRDELARAAGHATWPVDGPPIVPVEHHTAHAASSFLVSPFDHAAFATLDGLGDFCSTLWGIGEGVRLEPLGRVHFPHSAGFFYSAGTRFLGFPHYGDEYKVMGLAAFGQPLQIATFRRMLRLERHGTFRLNLDYFVHHRSHSRVFLDWELELFSPRWEEELGRRRGPGEPIEQRHRDLAASLQAVLEEIYFHVLQHLQRSTGEKRLCLAGGVAFNAVANGKLQCATAFEELFVQPAAGDAGTALGAALYHYHAHLGRPRCFEMTHAYWGSATEETALARALAERGLHPRRLERDELLEQTARLLATGSIVGWFQGRMELGPRALGNRSILADPRQPDMQDRLNHRIKRRESFRPFAPAVPEEVADQYFETGGRALPFMIVVVPVRPHCRNKLPAVTHVDGTARVQTVSRGSNFEFWSLLHAVGRKTGIPVLLNTSFNENEPIVCTAAQALDCFLHTDLDALALGPYLLVKGETDEDRDAAS